MTLPFHQVCRISPFPTARRVFAQPLRGSTGPHPLPDTRYPLQLRSIPVAHRVAATAASQFSIRDHPRYLTQCAHPFRAAFGTLSRFARLWLTPSPNLPSSRLPRNKLVAEAFYLTGSIEKYGRVQVQGVRH